MSWGETNWPFLDVHDAAGAARLDQKIGLAAQERRDLQNVDGFGGLGGLRRLVNIGEDGESGVADGFQDAQTFFQTGAAVGSHARPVGLVERCFEDEGSDDLCDFAGEEVDVLFAFDDAGSGDERQRRAACRSHQRFDSMHDCARAR